MRTDIVTHFLDLAMATSCVGLEEYLAATAFPTGALPGVVQCGKWSPGWLRNYAVAQFGMLRATTEPQSMWFSFKLKFKI